MGSQCGTMAALARSYTKFLQTPSRFQGSVRQMSGHDADGYKVWKKAFLFGAVPVIIAGNVNAFILNSPPDPPEFVPYECLRIRSKKFPWGDGNKSLIHNSHMNALPDGYDIKLLNRFYLQMLFPTGDAL